MADYYANPLGSDSTGTGTAASPWKTLKKAIEAVPDANHRILYASGAYAGFKATRAFTTSCTVQSLGETKIEGLLELEGAANLTFKGGSAEGTEEVEAEINALKLHGANRGCHFVGMNFSTNSFKEATYCLNLSFKCMWISFRGCYFHKAWGGVGGGHIPGDLDINRSRYLSFHNCTFEDFFGDGVTFGSWEDVLFYRCLIQGVAHENTGSPHPDHFQLTGDLKRVVFDSCRLLQYWDPTYTALGSKEGEGATQMLFINTAVAKIDDVDVVNCLIATQLSAGLVGAKNEGCTNFKLRYSTLWMPNLLQGFELRGSTGVTTDSIIVGNILSSYQESLSSTAAVRDYNLIKVNNKSTGAHEIVGKDPEFVSLAGGFLSENDYHLKLSSPAKGAGELVYAPKYDIEGNLRSATAPSLGCFE